MWKYFNIYCVIFLFLAPLRIQSAEETRNLFHNISFSTIEKQSQRIARELKYNALIRYGIGAGIALSCGYLVVRLFFSRPAETPYTIPIDPGQFSGNDVLELKNMAQHYNAMQNKQRIGFFRTLFLVGKEMAVAITQQLLVLTIFTGLNNSLGPISKYLQYFDGIVSRNIEKIYHEGDLRWFVKTHTHCKQMLQEFQEHSKSLGGLISPQAQTKEQHGNDALIIPDEQRMVPVYSNSDYHKKIICDAWNVMINDVEALLGFIQYKKSRMNKDYDMHESIEVIINEIMQKTNAMSCHILETIQKSDDSTLLSMSQEYGNFLEEALQSFIKFEVIIT